jgi:hypothetical protein
MQVEELGFDEEEQAFVAAGFETVQELPEGAAGLDADFEEHRTYIDSVLEGAEQEGGEPPEYQPAHVQEGEEDEMDVDELDGEHGAAEGLSDGEQDDGMPEGGSSDGEDDFAEAAGALSLHSQLVLFLSCFRE